MARSIRSMVPRHGDAQPRGSPLFFRRSSSALLFHFVSTRAAPSRQRVSLPFSPSRLPPPSPRFHRPVCPLPFETREAISWSLLLGESRRASFNEKLISRASRRVASESRIFFSSSFLRALPLPAVSDFAASLFSFLCCFLPVSVVRRVRFFFCERRANRAFFFFFSLFPRLEFARRLLSTFSSSVLPGRFYRRCRLRTAAPSIIRVGAVGRCLINCATRSIR